MIDTAQFNFLFRLIVMLVFAILAIAYYLSDKGGPNSVTQSLQSLASRELRPLSRK
jgi:hypothetical protein